MRKKDTLYKVNQHNRPMFMPEENLFDDGGSFAKWDRLASQAYGANYGDPGYTMQDYMNSKNFFGIAKKDNPFSKGNLGMSGAASGAGGKGGGPKMGGGAAWAAAAPGIGLGWTAALQEDPQYSTDAYNGFSLVDSTLTEGKKSQVGMGLVNSGAAVMNKGLESGNGGMALVGGIAGTLGTIINNGWGYKVNQKMLEAAERGIRANENFRSNASNFDDILMPTSQVTSSNVYKGGVFTRGKAARKNAELAKRIQEAQDHAYRSVQNNIDNIISDQLNNALANYSAFGGPIEVMPMFNGNNRNMGAIEYGFMSDYLDTKQKNAENKNQMTNMFMGSPSTMFDLGGDIQMNGGDFSTGLTHIDAGGSHEENVYDGVQLGQDENLVPNLVEEGETVFNDYVFSNRILADDATKKLFHLPKKKDITFADISKKLEKEISERPNDPISEAGFKAQMQTLEEQQERQKQEMEAERAKAAFEALSPEEQTAVMQRLAQEEAMAQQAEAQAQAQQPTPEETQMMQQQQMMQADGSQAALGQEPQQFAEGGDMKKRLYKLLGINTDSEYKAWLKKNNLDDLKDAEDFDNILKNEAIMKAATKDNPALADAISRGYDFGAYEPLDNGKATIKSISKGNWKATNGLGWIGSDDPAWTEAVKGMSNEDIKKLSTEDVARLMRATDSYKKGSEWLQNKDNALLYLNTLMNDPDTPQVAKDYAAKFVKDGQWKDGFDYDYATVFGSNGKGVRETNPGTYWHTPVEATRGNMAKNMVINPDGTVEEIVGDVPTDWTSAGNYAWQTPENDLTYNYYQRPVVTSNGEVLTTSSPQTPPAEVDNKGVAPKRKADWMRYAGLFGPAVGLGMQLAGVGKPDYSDLDAAVDSASDVSLASYKPLGDYLKFRPMDIWFEQNRMDANARATDRAILNNASPIGTKMAGLLASGYNNQIADGELYRKALEYNDALRERVAQFNRGTNQFNADAFNQTSRFNASARNEAAGRNLNARLHAAQTKLENDAGWYNSLYGNVSGLFKGLSDLGRENAQHNMIAQMWADGLAGTATPDTYTASDYLKWQKRAAKGGDIKRKKGKKRGLTF